MARPQLTETEVREFRDATCKAALALIGESGVDSLTVRALGDRLGCSYAKPYRYFGDKDQLIDALREHAFNSLGDYVRGDHPQSGKLEPIQRYVQFALDYSAEFEVMFGFNQPYVSQNTRDAEERAWAACSQPIHEMIDRGELVGDAEEIAHILWVALHGISTLALANKLTHGKDPAELLGLLSRLIRGYRPEASSP